MSQTALLNRSVSRMSPVHVMLAVDPRCVMGCTVSIRSMLANSRPGSTFHFHVIASGISEHDRGLISRTATESSREASVTFGSFDTELVQHLSRSKLVSRTAYARLFIGQLLPAGISRCVYVDCDIVFERDVVDLWEADLGGHTIGAVANDHWEDPKVHQKRLGLREASYFNSGVLLIDVDRWRARDMDARALTEAERIGDYLYLFDQDALNAAFEDDWLPLEDHWNVWVIHPDLKEDSPAVFHFMGGPKPWQADYSGRFADKFFHYLDDTPFTGWRPWNPLGLGRILKRLQRRVPYLPAIPRMLRIRRSAARTGDSPR